MQPDGSLTVLVIAEDAAARAALIGCVEADYRVLTTSSGRNAFAILGTEGVDLLLCTQRVADMSGVEFLREMRISHPEVSAS